ncbi:MAG: VTT domain-containing protein [Rhodocyclales bacterium]|nr:VTT domain-containing protein [Rhodocyclales bacterium]
MSHVALSPAIVWIRTWGRLLVVVAFVGVLLLGLRLSGLAEQFELATLQRSIAGHPLGGVLFFVVLFSLGNLLLIPGWVFLASAVYAFGAPLGGVATYAAACVSCVVTFFVIRLLGGDALRRLKSPLALRIFRRLDTVPLRSVVALRMLFQTLPALNGALALSGIRFRHYLLGTLLGLPLPIAIYVIFFDQLALWLGALPRG